MMKMAMEICHPSSLGSLKREENRLTADDSYRIDPLGCNASWLCYGLSSRYINGRAVAYHQDWQPQRK
jgi:hypothetical protein